jgi:hypothetical protein
MSEQEKIRAIQFFTVLGALLLVLFSLQSPDSGATQGREPLEVCAASKGAICDDPASPEHRLAIRGAETVGQAMECAPAPELTDSSGAQLMGSMTVTASRLPKSLAKVSGEPAEIRLAGTNTVESAHRPAHC